MVSRSQSVEGDVAVLLGGAIEDVVVVGLRVVKGEDRRIARVRAGGAMAVDGDHLIVELEIVAESTDRASDDVAPGSLRILASQKVPAIDTGTTGEDDDVARRKSRLNGCGELRVVMLAQVHTSKKT